MYYGCIIIVCTYQPEETFDKTLTYLIHVDHCKLQHHNLGQIAQLASGTDLPVRQTRDSCTSSCLVLLLSYL